MTLRSCHSQSNRKLKSLEGCGRGLWRSLWTSPFSFTLNSFSSLPFLFHLVETAAPKGFRPILLYLRLSNCKSLFHSLEADGRVSPPYWTAIVLLFLPIAVCLFVFFVSFLGCPWAKLWRCKCSQTLFSATCDETWTKKSNFGYFSVSF